MEGQDNMPSPVGYIAPLFPALKALDIASMVPWTFDQIRGRYAIARPLTFDWSQMATFDCDRIKGYVVPGDRTPTPNANILYPIGGTNP